MLRVVPLSSTSRRNDEGADPETSRPRLDVWVAYGPPEDVIGKLPAFFEAGANEITIRITSWDQRGQLERLVREVIPAFHRDPATVR